jgi:ATP-dependent exoDNAse (exonuclease V) beta subunit
MDESVHSEGEGGAGMAFGTQVHDFAEDYIAGNAVEPASTDEEQIIQLIDGLDGTLSAEQEMYLPLSINETLVTLSGVIDLLVETPDAIRIIDYKTDRSRVGVPEYRKQLSVYHHAVSAIFPDRPVVAELYFTEDGELHSINPLDMTELKSLVAGAIADAN